MSRPVRVRGFKMVQDGSSSGCSISRRDGLIWPELAPVRVFTVELATSRRFVLVSVRVRGFKMVRLQGFDFWSRSGSCLIVGRDSFGFVQYLVLFPQHRLTFVRVPVDVGSSSVIVFEILCCYVEFRFAFVQSVSGRVFLFEIWQCFVNQIRLFVVSGLQCGLVCLYGFKWFCGACGSWLCLFG